MGLLSWLRGEKKSAAADADKLHANHRDTNDSDKPAADDAASEGDPDEVLPGESNAALNEMLDSSRGAERVDAARALLDRWRNGDTGAASALAPRLDALLEDTEPLVRQSALAAVRMMRKPENLARVQSGVLARLSDPAAPVRTAAIWAAAHLPGEVARTQVRAQLDSPEEPMRFSAACALADKQDSAAMAVLLDALEQEHLRQESLSALMALGDAAATGPIAELFESERQGAFDRTLTAAALARFGDERGAAHLVARIEEPSDDRPVAAEWAGRLRVQQACEALFSLADEEGDLARGAALRALGRLRAAGAEEKLLGLAGDGETAEDLRMDAAEGLAELGTPAARALLEKLAAAEGELASLAGDLLAEMSRAEARAAEEAAAAAPTTPQP